MRGERCVEQGKKVLNRKKQAAFAAFSFKLTASKSFLLYNALR